VELFVHFAAGTAGALAAFTLLDWAPRREFIATLASGLWGVLPDGHWMLSDAGFAGAAAAWKAAHASAFANAFWLHRALDRAETGNTRLESAAALAVLAAAGVAYWYANDWSADGTGDREN
jgi:hypothetical protein